MRRDGPILCGGPPINVAPLALYVVTCTGAFRFPALEFAAAPCAKGKRHGHQDRSESAAHGPIDQRNPARFAESGSRNHTLDAAHFQVFSGRDREAYICKSLDRKSVV